MRRLLLALLLILGLAPATCMRQPPVPFDPDLSLRFIPLKLPSEAAQARHLGAFTLEGAWEMKSPYSRFGGYSALLPLPDGRLAAISDSARRLVFTPPGAAPRPVEEGDVLAGRGHLFQDRDTEAATQDPVTGKVWIAREDSNAISRHDPGFRGFVSTRPAAMRGWARNGGPEAMVRLADGRFIVLQEVTTSLAEPRLHRALLFAQDPLLGGKPARFSFAGSPQFSATDMAQLPDGRVLILMRRLVWPFPLRFAGRIMIADPAAIRPGQIWQAAEVAKLSTSLPVDNFEGLAIVPRAHGHQGDGRVTVWLISDDNHAATQRTLLWKLAVDPRRLP